jgi:hypothetical protein
MIEIESKKLDLMQSMDSGREDWDTTYHFLMSLWEPINRLPEDRQMFLRMKIQEIILQETPKQKGTQSSASSLQMQLFHYEDGRSNQGERGQHLTAHPFFRDFRRVITLLYLKLLVFPLSNIPHFVVGSLSLPYFEFTMIKGHLTELTNIQL